MITYIRNDLSTRRDIVGSINKNVIYKSSEEERTRVCLSIEDMRKQLWREDKKS